MGDFMRESPAIPEGNTIFPAAIAEWGKQGYRIVSTESCGARRRAKLAL
jgi:hypothetical protein